MKNKTYNPGLTVRQGDIILVDYGKNSNGCRTSGIKPSIVVSNNKSLKDEKIINVIPLYRSPSKAFKADEVLVSTKDCRGLRYDEYVQPFRMQPVPRYRIKKRIGSVTNERSLYEIAEAICRIVEVDGIQDRGEMS